MMVHMEESSVDWSMVTGNQLLRGSGGLNILGGL